MPSTTPRLPRQAATSRLPARSYRTPTRRRRDTVALRNLHNLCRGSIVIRSSPATALNCSQKREPNRATHPERAAAEEGETREELQDGGDGRGRGRRAADGRAAHAPGLHGGVPPPVRPTPDPLRPPPPQLAAPTHVGFQWLRDSVRAVDAAGPGAVVAGHDAAGRAAAVAAAFAAGPQGGRRWRWIRSTAGVEAAAAVAGQPRGGRRQGQAAAARDPDVGRRRRAAVPVRGVRGRAQVPERRRAAHGPRRAAARSGPGVRRVRCRRRRWPRRWRCGGRRIRRPSRARCRGAAASTRTMRCSRSRRSARTRRPAPPPTARSRCTARSSVASASAASRSLPGTSRR
uniref:Uncharacterized protein n=1 Tax=Zea mays TaxID=4577 RepID=A0A804P0V0_MAIZE